MLDQEEKSDFSLVLGGSLCQLYRAGIPFRSRARVGVEANTGNRFSRLVSVTGVVVTERSLATSGRRSVDEASSFHIEFVAANSCFPQIHDDGTSAAENQCRAHSVCA